MYARLLTTAMTAIISASLQMADINAQIAFNDNETVTYVASCNINIRERPEEGSDIVAICGEHTELECIAYDDEWSIIAFGDRHGYVRSEYLSEISDVDVSNLNQTRKSFMDYRTITDKTSRQYKLQKEAYTSDEGIRMVDGRYCIAIGNGFEADTGTPVDLTLADDTVIECVVSDIKQDIDTDDTNMVANDGSIAEFVVDRKVLDHDTLYTGDICSIDGFSEDVVNVRVYVDEDMLEMI